MDLGEWINLLPLWAVFLVTMALSLGSVELGTTLAGWLLKRKAEREPEALLASLVGAIMGLLAFILAFTFGMTAARFETRKQLVLNEANAIGTTYLRASLLPKSHVSETQRLLREYAELRVSITLDNYRDNIRQAESIHGRLWSLTQSLIAENMDSEIRSLYIKSLNEMIDLHQCRKTVMLQHRIPGTVWLAVYLLTVLSMLCLGYQIGMSGRSRMWGTPVLVAAFSLVVLMIADTDRPGAGLMRVSQQPIADVLQTMNGDSP